jgi:hypothetical protein
MQVVLAKAVIGGEPAGDCLRLPVTRDTWVSTVGGEANGNNGAAPRLKLKSIQEMTLLDLDPTPLRGRVIKSARLHLRLAGPERLRRVTVGTLSAEWVEGTGSNYERQPGSSTFNHRAHPAMPWSYPGSDLTSVMLGQGGSIWRMADAGEPDAEGWQSIAVAPDVVAARVAGISHGFIVFDDTGSEWTREGERWTQQLFPNRFVYSKDQNAASAPYFEIELGPEDREPPDAPSELRGVADGSLEPGEFRVAWKTPADAGGSGTLGFFVTIDGHEVERYLIPAAGAVGNEVSLRARDLELRPGSDVRVQVRAVDGAGNVGPTAEAVAHVSDADSAVNVGPLPEPFKDLAPLPKLGDVEISIIDELDKFNPRTNALIPEQGAAYLAANHIWSAKERKIVLHAAKGEFVGFQVLVKGGAGRVAIEPLTFDGVRGAQPRASFGRYQDVETKLGRLPDPVVPMKAMSEYALEDDGATSFHVEIHVPANIPARTYTATLRIRSDSGSLSVPVLLQVWDFALPPTLSFLPELNCYDLPANERDFYRLAHEHRTALNRVPYFHNGRVAEGCAPKWDGKQLDFKEWDKRFGPLFDASAFEGLPREGRPIDVFYLPLFENWPVEIAPHYDGGYWADRAFTPEYRAAFVEATRQFTEHIRKRGWHATVFQFYLNGKNDFKREGWSRSTSPWLLDEPANFQDFWALRYFGLAFNEGVRQSRGPQGWSVQMCFRADISRPQWQREVLDGVVDYAVVGSEFRRYQRLVLDRAARGGQTVLEYGGSNRLEESNLQPVAWCLDAWSLKLNGVLPWQTVGTANSWKAADELALFYPGRTPDEGPIPSIRLKAYRRGQQDVEYMELAGARGIQKWVREQLFTSNEPEPTQERLAEAEDAGRTLYLGLKPQTLWALRTRAGEMISKKQPSYTVTPSAIPGSGRSHRGADADYMVHDR